MTASSRGGRAAVLLMRSTRHPRVCSDCILRITSGTPQYQSLSRRAYSAAATAQSENATSPPPPPPTQHISSLSSPSSSPYTHLSGLILSRPPLLTPNLTPFEKSFFFYQKRLNERLAIPFTRYFYFKKDTPADLDWKVKAKERGGTAARELGAYQAYGESGWNDELLVKEGGLVEPGFVRDTLVKESRMRAQEGKDGGVVEVDIKDGEGEETVEGVEALGKDEAVEKLNERITRADKERDVRRLDRKLTRTLYLVVKREGSKCWEFPAGGLLGKENLHQAAERILIQSCGLNMNTWIIGHVPITHCVLEPRYDENKQLVKQGSKTFYMKGRIMAGQVDLKGSDSGISDWRWLTKQELERSLEPVVWRQVRGALGER